MYAATKQPYSGLGTGIAASAFIKHGISTSIVEIDPAVYEAATLYFGLEIAEPEKVSIMDARAWVAQKSANLTENNTNADDELFDYVIHDCFSGGSVPGHMFTKSFWEDLSKIVKPDGVIAVVSPDSSDLRKGILTIATERRWQAQLRLYEVYYCHIRFDFPSMPRIP